MTRVGGFARRPHACGEWQVDQPVVIRCFCLRYPEKAREAVERVIPLKEKHRRM